MVCTGAKSGRLAHNAIYKVIRELKSYDIVVKSKTDIIIQNIVASANLNGRIDLETAADIMDNVMYEPEQFPGLIYRMPTPKVVMLLFASGKVVCTGAKNEEMVVTAIQKIYEELLDFDLIF